MKGRFKDQAKRIILVILLVVISVLTISIISGRISTEEVILVKKEGLNTSLPLEEQLEFFEVKEMRKSEIKYFKGTVVTDIGQLQGKSLLYSLSAGSPIPLSALNEENGAGQFAAKMPAGRTVYLLADALLGLPAVQEGDKINIALSYKEKSDDGTESIRTGVLMSNVPVYRIAENSVFVDVSLEQSYVLSTAAQLGTFIYQVPGQKIDSQEPGNNSTPSVIKQSDIFDAILNKTYTSSDGTIQTKSSSKDDADDISSNVVKPENNEEDSENEDNSSDNAEGNSGGGDNESE